MDISSSNFKIYASPLRGWPVRGLHVLISPLGQLPGIILVSEKAAQEVEQRLLSLKLSQHELYRLCSDPKELQAFLEKMLPDLAEVIIPPEVIQLLQTLEDIGWSQAKLARKLQIDPNTVSRWVTGRTPVPTWALEYLSALKAIKDLVKSLDL